MGVDGEGPLRDPGEAAPEGLPLRRGKRGFDRGAVLLAAAIGWPLLSAIGVALFVESRLLRRESEPLLFRERRVSRGREFELIKFRILRAPVLARARREEGALVAIKQLEKDPSHLTGTGRFLKRWYLDELPQLWNVWRGEMSLVGPRPWDQRSHRRGLARGETLPKQLLPCGLVGPVQMNKSQDRGDPQLAAEHEYLEAYRGLGPWALLRLDLRILRRCLAVASRGEGF